MVFTVSPCRNPVNGLNDRTPRAIPAQTSSAKKRESNAFVTFVKRFKNDRREFVRRVFHVTPDPWQDEVLKALDEGATRITIRSGHGVGKTSLLAWVTIHFIMTRAPTKVAVTAPTAPQLFDGVAAETKMWITRMCQITPAFTPILTVKSERIELTAWPEASFVTYRTSRKETPEALQGLHAAHVLLIADEASGIDDAVFNAAGGSMSTPGAITIMAGNPTRREGYFFDSHHKFKEGWKTFAVSCIGSSRVTEEFVREKRDQYGEDSQEYRIRVLGEFPLEEKESFIPWHIVNDAVERDVATEKSQPIYWGVDVARFGADASALAKRQGNTLKDQVKIWRGLDTMQLVGAIKVEYDAAPWNEKPEEIFVDVIGLGAGVADRLRELNLPAIGINVAESPSVSQEGMRLRDDLWVAGHKWFMTRNARIPKDEALVAELSTARASHTSNGKIKIESKDEMKRRGVASPNRADAFLLTFSRGGAIAAGLGGTRWKSGKPLKRQGMKRV